MDIKSCVLNYLKLQLMLAIRDNRKQSLIYYKGKVTYVIHPTAQTFRWESLNRNGVRNVV